LRCAPPGPIKQERTLARRKSRLLPLALSPAAAAESLSLPVRFIHECIYKTATLEAFLIKNRVRIPVDSLLRFVHSFDRATVLNMKRRKQNER